jgi:hypothetical protein
VGFVNRKCGVLEKLIKNNLELDNSRQMIYNIRNPKLLAFLIEKEHPSRESAV